MTDKPIIFSAPMILALLSGSKTMTRRVLKPRKMVDHVFLTFSDDYILDPGNARWLRDCHGFVRGDRLWVRENFAHVPASAYRASTGVHQTLDPTDSDMAAIYAAGWERSAPRWKPSIHMPRWASRITLIVEGVKVERMQDISEADAQAEGIGQYARDGLWTWAPPGMSSTGWHTARGAFDALWTSIHGPDAWAANPWVAAITFEVLRENIDARQF